jgi:hypothetical protein
LLILDQTERFNRLQPADFATVFGSDRFDYVAMKTRWRVSVNAAREFVSALPPAEVGALYLDSAGRPVDPRKVAGVRPHYASLGGATPRLAGGPAPLPPEWERGAEAQLRERYRRDP